MGDRGGWIKKIKKTIISPHLFSTFSYTFKMSLEEVHTQTHTHTSLKILNFSEQIHFSTATSLLKKTLLEGKQTIWRVQAGQNRKLGSVKISYNGLKITVAWGKLLYAPNLRSNVTQDLLRQWQVNADRACHNLVINSQTICYNSASICAIHVVYYLHLLPPCATLYVDWLQRGTYSMCTIRIPCFWE